MAFNKSLALLCLFSAAFFPQYGHALILGVKDDGIDSKYCIVLEFQGITGSLQYTDSQGNLNSTHFAIPADANSTTTRVVTKKDGLVVKPSKCDEHNQRMTIEFEPSIKDMKEQDKKWYLFLEFNKTDSEGTRYELNNFELNVTFFKGHNASMLNYTYEMNATAEWAAQMNVSPAQSQYPNGFICSESKLALSNDSSLSFDHFKVVAFEHFNFTKPEFPDGQVFEQCPLDVRTSDLIPIIVGALLAGLVIVVLVAYLIGRARAKRQGYASV